MEVFNPPFQKDVGNIFFNGRTFASGELLNGVPINALADCVGITQVNSTTIQLAPNSLYQCFSVIMMLSAAAVPANVSFSLSPIRTNNTALPILGPAAQNEMIAATKAIRGGASFFFYTDETGQTMWRAQNSLGISASMNLSVILKRVS